MLKHQIVPAILVKDKKELINRLNKVKNLVDRVQIDLMDNKFVKNKTVQLDSLYGLKTRPKLEVHLMVKEPDDYIDDCKKANAWMVLFHIEACRDKKGADELIKHIRKNKMKVGIAINPRTSISILKPFLKKIDQVLVMTINPGFGGQEFIDSTLKKIRQLRAIDSKIAIEVDGGINISTISKAASFGANVFVAGSAIFEKKNAKEAIDALLKQAACQKQFLKNVKPSC